MHKKKTVIAVIMTATCFAAMMLVNIGLNLAFRWAGELIISGIIGWNVPRMYSFFNDV